MNKVVTVRDLWSYFGYRQICGNDESLNRIIRDVNTNRPGLELSGYLESKAYRRIVIIGEKEHNYIKTMSDERQREAFEYLTDDEVPMILISRDLPCPEILMEIAQRKNFPVFSSYAPTNSLVVEIVSYLEEFFAPVESVHGVLLQLYGRGVLITGESGVGKSEIALELIKKGHLLVADDRVDVYRIHNHLSGEAPTVLKGMLEIRGVGVIDVPSMFGAASVVDKSPINYVIYLEKWNSQNEYNRLGDDNSDSVEYFGISIPKLTIPVSEGRSIATVIEAAVINFVLRDKGLNSTELFEKRVIDFINSQKEEQ